MAGKKIARTGKPTLSGRLAETLRARILSGDLAPGEKLNLDRMRTELGVSGSSLREAVMRLAADGLVLAEEQKGYAVAPVSLDDLYEVTELRAEVEPLALRHAIENGGLDWETGVMSALYRLNRTQRDISDPASVVAWERAHNAFHSALIGGSGLPLLLRFARQLNAMNDRYRRIFLSRGSEQRDLAEEHSAIAEAAVSRDAAAASDLLAAHIRRTGTALRERLTDALPESAA